MKPVYIVDIFQEVVMATAAKVLNTIIQNETAALQSSTITGINFQKGHKAELIETLLQMDRSPEYQAKKYPLVYLVQDFTEQRGRQAGVYAETFLQVLICHRTQPDRKVDDRYSQVFKPVLYPIYYELLQQLAQHKLVVTGDADALRHDKTDRVYWGRQRAGGPNDANQLTDFVDAIELNNLNIKFNFKTC